MCLNLYTHNHKKETWKNKKLDISAHVDIKDMNMWERGLNNAQKVLFEKYNILHVTLQPEIITENKKPLIGLHNDYVKHNKKKK